MNRSLRAGITALCLGLACAQSALCAIEPRYNPIQCRNGYGGAFVVMLIDTDTGCCTLAYGVDCSGAYYRYSIVRAGRPADSPEPYDVSESGFATGGAPYVARAKIVDGVIARVWGYDAGGYYEGVLSRM
jgi:hypothetical protein